MTETPFTSRALAAAGLSFLIVGAALYFAYSAVQGDTGLVELMRLNREEARLELDLAALRENRAEMENLTLRLSESWLDLDLLDERARDILGHVRRDEIVIR
ncbi:MAG: cell division protein FtsB [Paracoccaceae bacterium]|jgi:cell division protein FtsB